MFTHLMEVEDELTTLGVPSLLTPLLCPLFVLVNIVYFYSFVRSTVRTLYLFSRLNIDHEGHLTSSCEVGTSS